MTYRDNCLHAVKGVNVWDQSLCELRLAWSVGPKLRVRMRVHGNKRVQLLQPMLNASPTYKPADKAVHPNDVCTQDMNESTRTGT